ncbi:MAG: ribosome maturation factor RimP [Synergistaceae bacterium]|nr:ribosome maturation factor RimP [Synergistaceae bacterium]
MNEVFLKQIEDIVTSLGYECVNVAIRSEFGRLKLQILIDTLGGIDAGDCEAVSGHVSNFLDGCSDTFPERYYLEVSSPGIERPLFKLEDYERFHGREARIRLSKLIEGRKTFTGVLQGVVDGSVKILCENCEKFIPFSSIKGGNLIYRFGNENEKKKTRKKAKK